MTIDWSTNPNTWAMIHPDFDIVYPGDGHTYYGYGHRCFPWWVSPYTGTVNALASVIFGSISHAPLLSRIYSVLRNPACDAL